MHGPNKLKNVKGISLPFHMLLYINILDVSPEDNTQNKEPSLKTPQ